MQAIKVFGHGEQKRVRVQRQQRSEAFKEKAILEVSYGKRRLNELTTESRVYPDGERGNSAYDSQGFSAERMRSWKCLAVKWAA